MNTLLTDKEIGDLLDLEKEYTYPCSDGRETTTIDCREVVKTQVAQTLRAVGKKLYHIDSEADNLKVFERMVLDLMQTLLRGEMTNET